jgi:hypothetical protein
VPEIDNQIRAFGVEGKDIEGIVKQYASENLSGFKPVAKKCRLLIEVLMLKLKQKLKRYQTSDLTIGLEINDSQNNPVWHRQWKLSIEFETDIGSKIVGEPTVENFYSNASALTGAKYVIEVWLATSGTLQVNITAFDFNNAAGEILYQGTDEDVDENLAHFNIDPKFFVKIRNIVTRFHRLEVSNGGRDLSTDLSHIYEMSGDEKFVMGAIHIVIGCVEKIALLAIKHPLRVSLDDFDPENGHVRVADVDTSRIVLK